MKNNTLLDWYVDQWAWWMLQWYYAPYKMPGLMGDADKWVQQVSLNGARWSNLCKPNVAK
jgi:hypothetical protein